MTIRKSTLWTILLMVVLSFSIALSADVSIVRDNPNISIDKLKLNNVNSIESNTAVYAGKIRVHIIEPVSRWHDLNGYAFENAHLWYALLDTLSVPDASVWDTTITWVGADHNYPNITPENIGTAVAVFNGAEEICDAYPPHGYWFAAHYADASAKALPGVPGMNQTAAGFTHSVYVEEGTETT